METLLLLKVKFAATPFFGRNIGDRFGEVPSMAVKVLRIILAFAIRLHLRFSQNYGSILSRARAVARSIFDTNLNDMRIVGHHIAFSYGEAALPGLHLDSVVSDAKTDAEAESV